MKTAKLIIGIIGIVLSFVIMFQSCAVSVGDAITDNSDGGGAAGILVAILLVISGIVSVAARKSVGAGIFCMIGYGLAGFIASIMKGDFSDLGIWGAICLIFAAFYLVATIKSPDAKKAGKIFGIVFMVIVILISLLSGNQDSSGESTEKEETTTSVESEALSPVAASPESSEAPAASEAGAESTAAPLEESASQPADDNVSTEYKNALKKAQQYADFMHMSKAGVYNQLTSEYGEQFPEDAAQYAIDNLDVDWKANALAKAEDYSETMHMSKQGVYDQLTSEYGEKFTAEEAQYAVDNVNADWYANALAKAKSYSENMSMSKQGVYDQLISEYGEKFTADEAQYAIDNLE